MTKGKREMCPLSTVIEFGLCIRNGVAACIVEEHRCREYFGVRVAIEARWYLSHQMRRLTLIVSIIATSKSPKGTKVIVQLLAM
jgi:hypothetical protein